MTSTLLLEAFEIRILQTLLADTIHSLDEIISQDAKARSNPLAEHTRQSDIRYREILADIHAKLGEAYRP